jgi:hypothetical protein
VILSYGQGVFRKIGFWVVVPLVTLALAGLLSGALVVFMGEPLGFLYLALGAGLGLLSVVALAVGYMLRDA